MNKATQKTFIQKASLFIFLLIFNFGFSQTTDIITTTGAGTFTVPCDVTSIVVEAWGSGGAGGGTSANGGQDGGGAGAGGTYVSSTLTVTPGQIINYNVGALTTGVRGDGVTGEASWFNTTAILYAQGGAGGDQPNGGTANGGTGSTALSIGDTLIAGTNGANGNAGTSGAGGNGGNGGGAGGNALTTEANGNDGTAPGGGGGGAYVPDNTNHRGGHGGQGELQITYTTACITYCTPVPTSVDGTGITNVTFSTVNNTTGAEAGNYGDYSAMIGSGTQGTTLNVDITFSAGPTYDTTIWVDWGDDGTFDVADVVYTGVSLAINPTTLNTSFLIPIGATPGNHRMRIGGTDFGPLTDPCYTGTWASFEDYTLNVISTGPCSTPTAQATTLNLVPTDVTIGGTFAAATPAPDNYLVVMNTTGTTPSPVDTTTYSIGGTVGAGNTVIDIDGDTTFNATGLTPSTTYYFFIFSYNNSCTGGPLYYNTAPLTGNTTTLAASYCNPNPSSVDGTGITNVTFSTVNNTTGAEAGNYGDYSAMIGAAVQGTTLNVDITYETGFTYDTTIWVDWNDDGTFDVADVVYTGASLVTNPTTLNTSFVIPIGATPGNHKMRIGGMDFGPMTDPCYTGTFACFEDYTLNVIATGPCSTPTAQASGLILSPSGTTINGTYTAAAPAPDSYLVVANTTGVTPTPVDGTTYTIGGTLGIGDIIIDIDANTSFSASPLTASTTYYFFVFSYNGLCSGGPLYYNTSPLTGNATTGAVSYCIPSTTSTATTRYIDDVEFIGTLNDVSNFGTNYTAGGYNDYSGLANSSQQQGEGMNIYVAGGSRGRIKAWIDWNQDGTFDNTTEVVYDSGGIATTSTTFGYTIPLAQAIGTYTLRIRMYNSYDGVGTEGYNNIDFDACETFDTAGAYTEYGEAEDYTFDVVGRCDAQITSITNGEACGVLETVDLNVTGAGNVTSFNWYTNETGGAPLANTATGLWTTPAIATTTVFWVAADNGTCEAYERERIIAFLNAPATLTFTPSTPLICGENNPPIQISAASTTQIGYLIDEDFETGLGTFTENNITSNGAGPDAISTWQPRTSVFVPSENVWFPAISSGFGSNNFVMSNADSGTIGTENELISAVIDASTYINLTLELDMYFSRYNLTVPENVSIEVSTDGGATWPNVISNITNDVGYGSNFDFLSYDLSAFAGQANLRIRIYYFSDWGDGVAVDNIQLYGNNTINPLATWTQPPGVQIFEDAAGLIPYTGDSRNIIYVVPSPVELQTSSTWSFSASVTLANGCTAGGSVSLQNRTKYFMGATNDWNDPTNWSPAGVPTSANCVIIPNTYSANIASGIDGDAYNLNVQNGGTLDVQPTGTVTVQNFVDVDATGAFTIESTGSLIQVQDQLHADYVANTGDIDMKRIANIRRLDYVFWASPVANFPVTSISPGTNTGVIWEWNPTVVGNGAGNFGIWQNTTANMIDGKGYIVRGPDAFTTAYQNYTATFNGVPNNGTVNRTITRGTWIGGAYTGPTSLDPNNNSDNLNLIGNPFPSAIDAQAFMTANTTIEGAVHIWTHGTAPSTAIPDPFYADYGQNYTINDYITYNSTGTSTGAGVFSGNIGAGQGFFVTMEDTGLTSETVTFNNTMRSNTYGNADFYKTANPNDATVTNSNEKHRIWIDLTASNNQNNRILVGYVTGATEGKDRLFDATNINKSNFSLYSKIDDYKLLIQGRPVPFVETDKVNLDAVLPNDGEYTFAINSVDGLFEDENQGIYIEDLELEIIHNLRTSPYVFSGVSGLQEGRFILRYTDENKQLGIEEVITNNELSIFTANNQVTAVSNTSNIKSFTMHDVNGRLLVNNRNLNVTEYSINTNNYSTGTYLVTIELNDGRSLTKKVVF